MKKKCLNILIMSCDWRDDWRNSFSDFENKLKRDRLGVDKNNFLVLSWGFESYKEEKNEKYKKINLKSWWFSFKPIRDFITSFRFPYLVFRSGFKPDVIVVYDFAFVPAAWLIKVFKKGKIFMVLNNMPSVLSTTRSYGLMRSFYNRCLEKLFVDSINTFFTINEAMKSYIKGLGVRDENRIIVFSMDTIERELEYIRKIKKGRIRMIYGLSKNDKIILSVGRLEAEKNYFRLLELFVNFDKSYKLFILGQGSLEKALKGKVEELGLEGRVYFEGFVGREKIWDYYADADVFVLLSKSEALGVVFWEAMYMGVPVIGSNLLGIIESLSNNRERGLIWKEKEGLEEFIKKVEFCINNSLEKEKMIERAKNFVEDKLKNKIIINDVF